MTICRGIFEKLRFGRIKDLRGLPSKTIRDRLTFLSNVRAASDELAMKHKGVDLKAVTAYLETECDNIRNSMATMDGYEKKTHAEFVKEYAELSGFFKAFTQLQVLFADPDKRLREIDDEIQLLSDSVVKTRDDKDLLNEF